MKKLIIVRHAKSSWDALTLTDFDRPLNARGLHDAPAMARHLLSKGISIDAFISSPAVRAKTTALSFMEVFQKPASELILIPELYHPVSNALFNAVCDADNTYETICIFSHNPGITEFVNRLTTTKIDNMPTCGVFAITSDTPHWNEFDMANHQFWFFDYPKAI